MRNEANLTITRLEATEHISPTLPMEYSKFLDHYRAEYKINGHYLQVGQIESVYGWILNLSAVEVHILLLLEAVVPYLLYEQVAFKIPNNEEITKALLSGALGYTEIGKIICIYPETTDKAVQVARSLLRYTQQIKGPAIPGNYCLGGIVYTRFGSKNPLQIADQDGLLQNFAYNSDGKLVRDELSIPFKLPNGVGWPFKSLRNYKVQKENKILKGKYISIAVLKNDAKGKVSRALHLKRLWDIRYCIVKEGLENMSSDSAGRDIQDRLKWQYVLHKELEDFIPMPHAIDYFLGKGISYFVMEYVDGLPLSDVIDKIYDSTPWSLLDESTHTMLIQFMIEVIDIIASLHNRGYFHRDISPRNFMVTKDRKIVCIDLELAYNHRLEAPLPPFVLGTPGYMSPEQTRVERPTAAQDVYGLGGLMIRIFTSLSPKLFETQDLNLLYHHLLFLTGNKNIALFICRCLSHTPDDRPQLEEIRQFVSQLNCNETTSNRGSDAFMPIESKNATRKVIERGIVCLASDKMTTPAAIWFSRPVKKEKYVLNDALETYYSTGFNKGIAGVLYFVATAKFMGMNIEACRNNFSANWEFLHQIRFTGAPLEPGLYSGAAGTSIAFVKGVEAGLISMPSEMRSTIVNGFLVNTQNLSIAAGIAGQGLALLDCNDFVGSKLAEEQIQRYGEQLISCQKGDGSWIVNPEDSSLKGKVCTFSHGIAGLIYFLLCAYQQIGKRDLLQSALNGLRYLDKRSQKNGASLTWPELRTGNNAIPWFENGAAGIILVYIKAYVLTHEISFKKTAEAALESLRPQLMAPYLSLASGVAGLGNVYLEAYKAFAEDKWWQRAQWIANLLLHTYKSNKDQGIYWITDNTTIPTADLMTGNSGVLMFLLNYINPNPKSSFIFF